MTSKDSSFRLIGSRPIYQNPWISVTEDRILRPSGAEGMFGLVTVRDGATVLPLTSGGDVYLVREYKYAIASESVEAMSGALEEGETPLDGARRELKEELGLSADTWTYLGHVDSFTTMIRSRNHMFLAGDLAVGTPLHDPEEVIEPLVVPLDTTVKMVMNGEITHSTSCVLILKARLMSMTK